MKTTHKAVVSATCPIETYVNKVVSVPEKEGTNFASPSTP